MKEVTLQLKAVKIVRLKGGMDKVYLELDDNLARKLLAESVGEKIADGVFGNQLCCDFNITRNCGEALVNALGLEVDELIKE